MGHITTSRIANRESFYDSAYTEMQDFLSNKLNAEDFFLGNGSSDAIVDEVIVLNNNLALTDGERWDALMKEVYKLAMRRYEDICDLYDGPDCPNCR